MAAKSGKSKRGWTEDVSNCLLMMFDPGDLFDEQRMFRAEAVLKRMHPLFAGSVRDKLVEQLAILAEQGAVERVAEGVYRWLGLESATPPPARAPAPTPAPAPAPRKKKPALTAEDFQGELARRFDEATAAGKEHLHVAAFDLHRVLAPYPAPGHRMGLCCRVMRQAVRDADTVLSNPTDGKDGPGLLIRFMLPR